MKESLIVTSIETYDVIHKAHYFYPAGKSTCHAIDLNGSYNLIPSTDQLHMQPQHSVFRTQTFMAGRTACCPLGTGPQGSSVQAAKLHFDVHAWPHLLSGPFP
jgi:hypothetical protein